LSRQKRYYDQTVAERSFEPGDLVYKLDTATKVGLSTKLKPVYDGPYLVTAVKSPVLYQIEGKRKAQVVHHDRLRICEDRSIPFWVRRKRHKFLFPTEDGAELPLEEDMELAGLFETEPLSNSTPVPPPSLSLSATMLPSLPISVVSPPTAAVVTSPTSLPVSRTGRLIRRPTHLKDYDLE